MLKLLFGTIRESFGGAAKNYIKLYKLLKDQDWLEMYLVFGNKYLYEEAKKEGAKVAIVSANMTQKFATLKDYKNKFIELQSIIHSFQPDIMIIDEVDYMIKSINILDVSKFVYIQAKIEQAIKYLSENQDRAKYVIAVSLPIYEFVKNFIDEKKLILIPNWIEDIEEMPRKFEDVKEFKVGWASRLIKDKGWEDLVEAFKNTDIKVEFIGNGPDMGRAKIIEKEYVNFKFLGFIEQEPREYLKENASVYVFSSKVPGESFGLTLAEAMSVGIPCIAYKTDIAEYVLGTDGLFYETIDELRKLVFRLKEDKDFYNERAKYSLERAKIFSKEQAKEKFIKLFKSLEETEEAIQ